MLPCLQLLASTLTAFPLYLLLQGLPGSKGERGEKVSEAHNLEVGTPLWHLP